MKKTILTLATALFVSAGAFAQSGSLWLGGGIGFSTDKHKTETAAANTDDWKSMNFSITPHVEYFLMDDISIIAGLGYNFEKTTTFSHTDGVDDQIVKTNMFGFSVGARKYWSINDRFSFYAGAQFDMGFAGGKDEQGSRSVDHDKTTAFDVYLYPGVAYKLGNKVVLYAQLGNGLGYMHRTTTDADDNDHKEKRGGFYFGFDSDPALEFGIMYKLF